MDAGRVSDFSIERILSPQPGPGPDGYLRGVFRVDSVTVRPPAPIQVPMQVIGCQQCKEMSWNPFYRAAFHHQNFYANYGVYAHFSQNSAGKDTSSNFYSSFNFSNIDTFYYFNF